jgi:hypothetical protein
MRSWRHATALGRAIGSLGVKLDGENEERLFLRILILWCKRGLPHAHTLAGCAVSMV